jgi:hypothetical protein
MSEVIEPVTAPRLGASTVVLLSITVSVLATACFLATYVVVGREVTNLELEGFLVWSGSSAWADVALPMPWISPGENILYHFEPTSRLTIAFADLPIMRASMAGLLMFGGGHAGVTAAMRWHTLKLHERYGLNLVCVIGMLAGVALVFPDPPHQFAVDLRTQTIGSIFLTDSTEIPLNSIMGIGDFADGSQDVWAVHLYAATPAGPIDLAQLHDDGQAHALAALLMTFIQSKGGQIQ